MTTPRKGKITPPAATSVAKSFRAFSIKQKADSVLQNLEFKIPGVGPTGHSLRIRSQHSTVYREAVAKSQRQISALYQAVNGDATKVDEEQIQLIQDLAFATLVESWSFEEECTAENVNEFLKENPTAYEEINILAANDTLFFSEKEKS